MVEPPTSKRRDPADAPRFVRALRGAVVVRKDTREEISKQVELLLSEAFDGNRIASQDLISVIFTATSDIRSSFPATEARNRFDLGDVPLLCARELEVDGSTKGVIRVLIHFYTDLSRGDVRHAYPGAAAKLRPDLSNQG